MDFRESIYRTQLGIVNAYTPTPEPETGSRKVDVGGLLNQAYYNKIFNTLRFSLSDDPQHESNSEMYLWLGTTYFISKTALEISSTATDRMLTDADLKKAVNIYERFCKFAPEWLNNNASQEPANATELLVAFAEQEDQHEYHKPRKPETIYLSNSKLANKVFNRIRGREMTRFKALGQNKTIEDIKEFPLDISSKRKKTPPAEISIKLATDGSKDIALSRSTGMTMDAIASLCESAEINGEPLVFDFDLIWQVENGTDKRPTENHRKEFMQRITALFLASMLVRDPKAEKPYLAHLLDGVIDYNGIRKFDGKSVPCLYLYASPIAYQYSKDKKEVINIPYDVFCNKKMKCLGEKKKSEYEYRTDIIHCNGQYYSLMTTQPSIKPYRQIIKTNLFQRIGVMKNNKHLPRKIKASTLYELIDKENLLKDDRDRKADVRDYAEQLLAFLCYKGWIKDFSAIQRTAQGGNKITDSYVIILDEDSNQKQIAEKAEN